MTPRPQRFPLGRYRAEFGKLVRRLALRGPEREAAALKRASRVGLPRPVASPRRTRLGIRLRRMENFWKFPLPIIDHGTSQTCPTDGLRKFTDVPHGRFEVRASTNFSSPVPWGFRVPPQAGFRVRRGGKPAGLARGRPFRPRACSQGREGSFAPIAARRFPAPPVSVVDAVAPGPARLCYNAIHLFSRSI